MCSHQFAGSRRTLLQCEHPLGRLRWITHWLLDRLDGIDVWFFRRGFLNGREIRPRRLWIGGFSGP
jgi:hypothetical protein